MTAALKRALATKPTPHKPAKEKRNAGKQSVDRLS